MPKNNEVKSHGVSPLNSGLSTKALAFYLFCSFIFFLLGTYHIWNGFQDNHELSKYLVGTACLVIATGYIFLIKAKRNRK